MAAPFVQSRRTKKTANGKNRPTIRHTDVFRSTTIAIQKETESTILQSYLQKASILLTKKHVMQHKMCILFAYIKEKQYLCNRYGAPPVFYDNCCIYL